MIPLLVVLAAALAGWFVFPPLAWGWLVFTVPLLLLWTLRRAPTGWVAGLWGLAFGIAYFGVVMWWISRTEGIALIALVLSQAMYFFPYGWLVRTATNWSRPSWWLAVTGGWALMEFLRARWPVGGLTWAGLGFGLAPYDWARGAAAWIGASGWTVVIVGVAALLLDRIQHRQGRAWIAGSVGLAVLLLLGLLYPATAQGAALEVTIVQGNSPCPRDHCAGEREQIFDAHLRLTRTIEPGTADLVVWAESSTGFSTDPLLNPSYAELIGEEARRIGAFFLIGGDRPLDDGHFVNANMLFGPDGRYLGEYNKQHAVPFGEYVPWRSVFGRIPATDRVPRDMVPGSGPVVFDLGPGTIGSVISFEGAFARYLREHVQAGAELLVVTTNESSYGVGPAADQLIGMTRMHAAANGVDLVQAAVTGRSVIITNGGELPEATPLYEEAVLDGVVRFRQSGPTLYTRWGDWLQIMLAAAATVLVVVRRLRNTEGHGTWPSESRL